MIFTKQGWIKGVEQFAITSMTGGTMLYFTRTGATLRSGSAEWVLYFDTIGSDKELIVSLSEDEWCRANQYESVGISPLHPAPCRVEIARAVWRSLVNKGWTRWEHQTDQTLEEA